MRKPTKGEFTTAKNLGIEGAENMTSSQLLEAIAKARRHSKSRPSSATIQLRSALYGRCQQLGVPMPGLAQLSTDELQNLYTKHLQRALHDLGVVKNAKINMPRGTSTVYGEAVVGGVGIFNKVTRDMAVTLTFASVGKPRSYRAWYVWVMLSKNK